MRLILAILLTLLVTTAHAYIGPGAGIPVIGSLIGIIVTVLVAIGAILFWPIRKLLKRGKNKAVATQENTESEADEIVDAVINDSNKSE